MSDFLLLSVESAWSLFTAVITTVDSEIIEKKDLQYKIMTSVFHASVLILIINFVITLAT